MFEINNLYNFANLPVPDKKTTLNKFLDWVKPLVNNEQYLEAQQLVEQYCNDDISDILHKILLERANNKNSSWLIDWWIKYCYLVTRGPVTPENNAPMIFNANNITSYDIAQIMSIIIYQIAKVYLEVRDNNNLINDQQFTPKKNYSLDQLVYLFSSIREPNKDFDTYYTNQNLSEYVIIYKNNIAYKLKVIKNNEVININEIYSNINQILSEQDNVDIGFNLISACTNHNNAKIILDDLLNDDLNKKSYQEIKDAIIVFSYDDLFNDNPRDIVKNFINNPKFNKFHGKCFLINIDNNKNVVMTAEHTKVDGGTEIYLMARIAQLFEKKPKLELIDNFNKEYDVLTFNITNNQLQTLKNIKNDFDIYCNKSDAIYLENKLINRIWCKEHNIVSVDGFIQLLFQIAQYKTNNEINNTYVAVDTRNFFKGRTECIRPISEASKALAIDFANEQIKDKDSFMNKLNEVMNIHYQRSKDCQAGQGINRYMLGLTLAYNENKDKLNFNFPKLFECKAWKVINQNILSTSSIVSPNIEWVFFNPVHDNGIGIFYAIKENNIRFCISYWIKDIHYAIEFAKNLEWAMNKIYKLIN